MKKTGIGLLWSLPGMWKPGKNCHFENIICPNCQHLQRACVLHTQGEPERSHLCEQCGKHIGRAKWTLAETPPPPSTPAPPDNSPPGAGCWVCIEKRENGDWPKAHDCEACRPATSKKEPATQGTLF